VAMITKEEKINLINEKIEGIDVSIDWLNANIGIIEEIPTADKLSMSEQLQNLIDKKNALLEVLDQFQ